VTDRSDDSSLFIDFSGNLMKFFVFVEVPNSAMSAGKVNNIVIFRVDLSWFFGVAEKVSESGICVIFPADFIHTLLQTGGIEWSVSTSGTDKIDGPSLVDEFIVEVDGLTEPEPSGFVESGKLLAAGDSNEGLFGHCDLGEDIL
jgi:hypothetical protein